jgi:hypothetical protein
VDAVAIAPAPLSLVVIRKYIMQTIKVMPDYECDPLWVEGVGNMPPSSFPISDELATLLWDWSSEYDQTLNQEYPPESGFKTKEIEQAFVEKGKELALKLKAQLGNEYNVVYFNVSSSNIENV